MSFEEVETGQGTDHAQFLFLQRPLVNPVRRSDCLCLISDVRFGEEPQQLVAMPIYLVSRHSMVNFTQALRLRIEMGVQKSAE